MDFLKFIPQLFYDLISRVIPGALLLLALARVTSMSLGEALTEVFVGAPALQESSFFLGLTLFAAAYLVGQLLAPVSDLYEKRVVWSTVPASWRVTADALEELDPSHFTGPMRALLRAELDFDGIPKHHRESTFQKALFVWYDWLRVWDPEAGARSAKVRAEYRMHAGIATVSWLALLVGFGVRVGARSSVGWSVLLGLGLVGTLSTWGLIRTFRTLQWIVLNQYYVAKLGGKGDRNAA